MEEIWKDIKDYEGLYQVSNLGNVKSLNRLVKNKSGVRVVNERILKPGIGNSGYYFVNLSVCQNHKCKDVHRMVALNFFGHENSHLTVNHIDGNKLNNNLLNLEMISQKENNIHKIKVLGKKACGDIRGSKNGMFGKKHSEETLAKLRKPKSEEHKLKISISRKLKYAKNSSDL